MKKIFTIIICSAVLQNATAQIRAIDGPPATVLTSSAFLDASSSPTYDGTTSSAKGIVFPRVDLTTFNFLGVNGTNSSFRNRYDGFIVYNTATSGVALSGATQGTLTRGFWYYDNSSAGVAIGTVTGGTWKAIWTGAATTKDVTATETLLDKVNGLQVYGKTGSFTLAAESATVPLAQPTGFSKLYKLNVYQSGLQVGVFSYDGVNLIFGGDGFSAIRPAATYNYVMEYFK